MGARVKNQISRPGEPEVFGFINAFDKSKQRARLERVQTLGGLAIPLCLRYLVASNRGGWTRGQTERDVSGKQLQRREHGEERRGLLYEMLCSLWPHQISLSVSVSYGSPNKMPDCRIPDITLSLFNTAPSFSLIHDAILPLLFSLFLSRSFSQWICTNKRQLIMDRQWIQKKDETNVETLDQAELGNIPIRKKIHRSMEIISLLYYTVPQWTPLYVSFLPRYFSQNKSTKNFHK